MIKYQKRLIKELKATYPSLKMYIEDEWLVFPDVDWGGDKFLEKDVDSILWHVPALEKVSGTEWTAWGNRMTLLLIIGS